MSDIDDLFDDFERWKAEEREEQDEEREEGILTSTVRPVLDEQAQKIRARGHKAELEENVEGPPYPHIELKFALQSQEKPRAFSSLTFSHHFEDKIRIEERIMFSEGGYTTDDHVVSQKEVTEEWVKEQVVSFIRSVLERH